MTCRVLCFVLSIKGKTLATFLVVHYAVCVNFCEIKRWLPSHILRVSKIQDYVKNLVINSIAALKSLKKHKRVYLYLLENPRKKESVVSEFARRRISKFLLVGSNRKLVV